MAENYIVLKYRDGVRTITINRPEKKNAISLSMYQTISNVLNEDAANDKVVVTILTGSGSYFTSGNDLKGSLSQEIPVKDSLNVVKTMIDAFINYPKLLIAVVNGPAIGIGATMAALCDIVYATNKAVFDTPFVKLGLCAEAASSFTFPHALGRSKASEVLLLNYKLSAQEAYQFGFISNIIPHSSLNKFINNLHKHGTIPVKSLTRNKQLIMANYKPVLYESINREMEQLFECMASEEFSNAILKFLDKKSKL
ncbi:enoyl-CoA delta isomerase 2, mitochondrial [Anoplophora glabripennis]|nr:enoyl-CoA delta isomerase 2, mitochondrial [Anoplophora glabripennis]